MINIKDYVEKHLLPLGKNANVNHQDNNLKKTTFWENLAYSRLEGTEKTASLKNYTCKNDLQKEAIKACKQYIRTKISFLVIQGSVGTGKTHLAAAVAKTIGYGSLCPFKILRCSDVDLNKLDFKFVAVLIIDDIGREGVAGYELKNKIAQITEIIDYRYRNKMRTIITSNMNSGEIATLYGDHIVDRMSGDAIIIPELTFASYRKKEKKDV